MLHWRMALACATLMLGGFSAVSDVQAQTTSTQFVFLVDESGSMGGEQTFLQTFVPNLDTQLATSGVTTRQYGLIGFGSSSVNARQLNVGGSQFGTAAEFATAVPNLLLDGSIEDGYQAIQYALDNYVFNNSTNTRRVLVLVTDEDRDNTSSPTFTSLEMALINAGISLSGILSQSIEESKETALGASSTQTFLDTNNDGVPETSGPPTFTGAAGTTFEDYTQLILNVPGGCVADLDQLRAGGNAADAFAIALADCFVQQAISGSVQMFNAVTIIGSTQQMIAFTNMVQSHVSMRLTGRLGGSDNQSPQSAETLGDFAGVVNGYFPVQAEPTSSSGDFFSVVGTNDFFPQGMSTFRLGDMHGFLTISGQISEHEFAGPLDYDNQFGTATIGVDNQFTPDLLMGISASFSKGSTEVDGTLDEVEQTMFGGSLYGSLTFLDNRAFMDIILGYSVFDLDITAQRGAAVFTGSTDGSRVSGYLELGYNYVVSNTTITPAVALSAGHTSVDSYVDSSGAVIGAFDTNDISVTPSVTVTQLYPQEWGSYLASAEVGVKFDTVGGDNSLTLTQGATVSSIGVPTGGDVSLLVNVGLGANVTNKASVRVDYQGTFGAEETSHSLTGRVRFALGE